MCRTPYHCLMHSLASEELHDKEELSTGCLVKIVPCHDVPMPGPNQRAGLPIESPTVIWLSRILGPNDFDCHNLVDYMKETRLVDRSHAPFSDLVEDLVPAFQRLSN